jgi:hypothetical protein
VGGAQFYGALKALFLIRDGCHVSTIKDEVSSEERDGLQLASTERGVAKAQK